MEKSIKHDHNKPIFGKLPENVRSVPRSIVVSLLCVGLRSRTFCGVHWRTDYSDGLKLGEAVALSILADQREMYGEEFSGFAIRRFNGVSVTA
jgi:hypothetical protein